MTPLERVLSMVGSINDGDIDAAVAHFHADVQNHGHVGQRRDRVPDRSTVTRPRDVTVGP
jgi:hypothetical protein